MTIEPRTRLVEVSGDLFEFIGTRSDDGKALSYEWGEPTGHEPDSDRYVYSPTITATDDGWLAEQRAESFAAGRAAALGPDSIDAAWAAVEAVLPEGWAINLLWGTVTEERWGANAGPWPSKPGQRQEYAGGPTPAAALRALEAHLAAHPAEAEEKPDEG